MNNLIMQNFMDSVLVLSPAQYEDLANIKLHIYDIAHDSATLLQSLKNSLFVKIKRIIQLDSLMLVHTTQQDSLYVHNQKDSTLSQINQIHRQLRLLNGYIQENVNQHAVEVRIQNSYLPDTVIYEENEKKVNDVYLRTAAIGKYYFSSEDKQTLQNISGQCPVSGGNAVYWARALYSLISDTLFEDKSLCYSQGIIKNSQVNNNSIDPNSGIKFKFYPNPANNQIMISWDQNSSKTFEIQVINSLGEIVLFRTFSGKSNFTVLETENLYSGLYVIRILSDSQFLGASKIMIVK